MKEIILWKRKQTRRIAGMILALLLCDIWMVIAAVASGQVFAAVMAVFFSAVTLFLARRMLKLRKQTPTRIRRGAVREKEIQRERPMHDSRKRIYFLTAEIDGERVKGECDVNTYRKLKVGDPAVFFCMGTERVYVVGSSD